MPIPTIREQRRVEKRGDLKETSLGGLSDPVRRPRRFYISLAKKSQQATSQKTVQNKNHSFT